MSGFQSPQVLTDLYRDLRDRRLLPLVLVLVLGLVIVPIALSSPPKSAAPQAPETDAAVPAKSSLPAPQVVLSDPGVRDYRRRLEGDAPTDPFVQQFRDALGSGTDQLEAAAAGVSTGGLTEAPTSEPTPGLTAEGKAGAAAAQEAQSESTSTGGSTESQPGAETTSKSGSKVVFYRLKVRTGEVGGKMKTQDEVGPSSSLPSKSVPGLAFLGATLDSNLNAKRAFFLVSNSVSAISGDGQCSFGNPCQLMALKPGQYVDVVWSDGLQYRVKLLEFERHTRDNPGNTGAVDNPPAGRRGSSSGGDSTDRKAPGRKSASQHFIF
jgi:hypothetical protein